MERTDWLDVSPKPETLSPKALQVEADDDWLKIEDPNAGKTTLAFQHLVDQCMRGTDRVMATDGKWMAYRPYNREKDKETNPRTKERVARFLSEGKWKHIGTYDEVQIYELLDGSVYKHKKNYVIGTNYRDDIDKVARAALERHWPDYHDLLDAMARALKSGRDPIFAKAVFNDTLTHILVRIQQLGGPEAPSDREINEGLQSVRKGRGLSTANSGLALPPESSLIKVQMAGKGA